MVVLFYCENIGLRNLMKGCHISEETLMSKRKELKGKFRKCKKTKQKIETNKRKRLMQKTIFLILHYIFIRCVEVRNIVEKQMENVIFVGSSPSTMPINAK